MSSSACTSTTVSVSDSSEFDVDAHLGRRRLRRSARTPGAARRPGPRGRSRPRARARSSRTTRAPPSSATRPNGSAPWNTSSARPSVVPNRLASRTSSPADGERAGERHQQPGPVAGDDGDHDVTARRRARTARSASRASSSSCMHIVSTSNASTYCSGSRARNAPARSSPRRSSQRVAPIGRDGLRLAALDRGRGLHEQIAHERGLRRVPRGRTRRLASRRWSSRYSSRSRSASPAHAAATLSATDASERSRRVATSAMRRWLRTSHGRISRASLSKPMRRTTCFGRAARRPRSGRRACPWRCRAAARRAAAAPAGGTHARRRASTSSSCPGSKLLLARVEQARALRDRFEQVPVDGVAVVRVALRQRAHVLPLREQPREHALVVERLEHRHRVVARTQQPHETGALPDVPGRLAGRPQPRQRRAVERHAVLGRRARGLERPQRRDRTVGVGVDVHASVAQPHALGDRLDRRRAASRRGPSSTSRTPRPHVARDPRDLARRAREIVHERVGRLEAELRGDRVLLLQREPVGVRVGDALQRDPDVEQQLAARPRPARGRPAVRRPRSTSVVAAARARRAPSRPSRATARRAARPRPP